MAQIVERTTMVDSTDSDGGLCRWYPFDMSGVKMAVNVERKRMVKMTEMVKVTRISIVQTV